MPVLCEHQGGGASAPYAGKDPSRARAERSCAFRFSLQSAVDVGVDAANGFQYVQVILEDVSGYTWLRPSRECTANGTVEEFVRWCASFGPPTTWVSDNATHFRNHLVRKLAKALGV